jgi:hypothetical protein
VVRSGCTSGPRPLARCPLISEKLGIGHTNLVQSLVIPNMREGAADLVRHPLNIPIPAGATVAGLELGPNGGSPFGKLSGRVKEG